MAAETSGFRLLCDVGAALVSRPADAGAMPELAADERAQELLRRHGLLAALHTDLDENRRARLAVGLRLAAEREHQRALLLNLHTVSQCAWLLDRLRAESFDFLVVKGPVMAHEAWGHLGARTFGDVDFLVRANVMDAAAAQLHAEGFEEGELPLSYERVFLHHARRLKVELHSRLVSRAFLPRLQPERAWPACEHEVPGIGRVPTPRAEFHFLFAAVHAAKHLLEFFFPPAPIVRFGLYVEIARWADRAETFDWEALLSECREIRCRRAVLHAPACARAWFGWRPPEPLAAAIDATPGLEALVGLVTAGIGVGHVELKRSPRQLWRQARIAAGLRDSLPEGAGFALRYFAKPLARRLTGRA